MRTIILSFLILLTFTTSAKAEVDITFYSHEFGKNFPHAFFTVKGKLEDGTKVDNSYGFTAVKISPAILWKKVTGAVQRPNDKYINKSNPHFTVTIDDDKYIALMSWVENWASKKQKNYSLNKRNCVHFISQSLALLGYTFNEDTKYWKKPKSFLLEVLDLNPSLIAIDYGKIKKERKEAQKNKDKNEQNKTSEENSEESS